MDNRIQNFQTSKKHTKKQYQYKDTSTRKHHTNNNTDKRKTNTQTPTSQTATPETKQPENFGDTSRFIDLLAHNKASELYHNDRASHFERAAHEGRFPNYVHPQVEFKFQAELDQESRDAIDKLNKAYQKNICEILHKHHMKMAAYEKGNTLENIALTKTRFPEKDTNEHIITCGMNKGIEKHVVYKSTKDKETHKRPRLY